MVTSVYTIGINMWHAEWKHSISAHLHLNQGCFVLWRKTRKTRGGNMWGVGWLIFKYVQTQVSYWSGWVVSTMLMSEVQNCSRALKWMVRTSVLFVWFDSVHGFSGSSNLSLCANVCSMCHYNHPLARIYITAGMTWPCPLNRNLPCSHSRMYTLWFIWLTLWADMLNGFL